MMTGATAMVRCLEAEGVQVLYGYPGAAICPFFDSLADSPVHHVLVRTEQNAAHAASGYARISGKVGVCVATSGPGATNLLTGIASAYMDSIPLVVITGQVRSDLLGRDVFQEADITGAAEPFTKHSYLIDRAADIPRVFKEAFHIAGTGRPGPVLIDVPIDMQQKTLSSFNYDIPIDIIGYKPRTQGHGLQIKKAAEAIAAATGGDLLELEPAEPYTSADLDYNNADSRVSREHDDETLRDVALKTTTVANWAGYDTVYIGYPIWWGIAAWPVDTFVKANDFTGKTVIPFCTSGSSDIGESGAQLAALAGTGDWQEGQRFPSAVTQQEVTDWVKSLGK